MFVKFSSFFLASIFFAANAFAYDSNFKLKNDSDKSVFVAYALEYTSGIDWNHYSDSKAFGFYKIAPGETKSVYNARDGRFVYTFLWFMKEGELPWTGSAEKKKLNLRAKGFGGNCEVKRDPNGSFWSCDVRGSVSNSGSHLRVYGSLDEELTKGKQFDFFEVKLSNLYTGGTVSIK